MRCGGPGPAPPRRAERVVGVRDARNATCLSPFARKRRMSPFPCSGMVQWSVPMMQAMTTSRFRSLAALSLSLVLGLARAQDNDAVDPDPPDRAARLSYLQGDVSMQP